MPALSACKKEAKLERIRVGYFPNLTHGQALIGIANGKFRQAMGGLPVETKIFNAGPSAVEALFAGAVDLTYIGPSPAINAYVKSNGDFKIIAGAASGGAALVVREDSGIKTVKDFEGKKIATPQLGNTQDVSARAWLKANGLEVREKGGKVDMIPVANPDQLTLFIKKELDGAWTVEPWTTRLVQEGGGRIYMNESEVWKAITGGKFATAVILTSGKFLKQNPDVIKKWVAAHNELTGWIRQNPDEAKRIINGEIKKFTGKALPEKVLNDSFKNIEYTSDPIRDSIVQSGKWAFEQGFLGKQEPDLSGICDLAILDQVSGAAVKK